jgi:RNA polymerase sigma factor FliA
MCTLAPIMSPAAGFVGREQLILRSAPLVRRAVGRYAAFRPAMLEAEDIYGYGIVGLIDAVDRYDQSRGVKFETYAITRIRGYLVDQLRAMDWLPRSARTNVRIVQNTAANLEASLGRKPDTAELAEKTGLPDSACDRALADGACRVVSLESIDNEHDDDVSSLSSRLEDESSPNPAEAAERGELLSAVARALAALPERESEVLRLRYVNEWTQRQIAEHLGISGSRVSQLHAQGLSRMRCRLVADFGDLSNTELSA